MCPETKELEFLPPNSYGYNAVPVTPETYSLLEDMGESNATIIRGAARLPQGSLMASPDYPGAITCCEIEAPFRQPLAHAARGFRRAEDANKILQANLVSVTEESESFFSEARCPEK